jgi:hypothetical protein
LTTSSPHLGRAIDVVVEPFVAVVEVVLDDVLEELDDDDMVVVVCVCQLSGSGRATVSAAAAAGTNVSGSPVISSTAATANEEPHTDTHQRDMANLLGLVTWLAPRRNGGPLDYHTEFTGGCGRYS